MVVQFVEDVLLLPFFFFFSLFFFPLPYNVLFLYLTRIFSLNFSRLQFIAFMERRKEPSHIHIQDSFTKQPKHSHYIFTQTIILLYFHKRERWRRMHVYDRILKVERNGSNSERTSTLNWSFHLGIFTVFLKVTTRNKEHKAQEIKNKNKPHPVGK